MPENIDWKVRIRAAFAASGAAPEEDILEELAGHAQAMYESARSDGSNHEDACRGVDRQIEYWKTSASGSASSPDAACCARSWAGT